MEKITIVKGIRKFDIKEEILKRKDWIKYKIIPDWRSKLIDEHIIVGDPGKEFSDVVEQYVNAYIFNKKDPPAEIATAIMNIADDYLSGIEPVVRAGDYIAIQNYIHAKK